MPSGVVDDDDDDDSEGGGGVGKVISGICTDLSRSPPLKQRHLAHTRLFLVCLVISSFAERPLTS